MVENEDIGRSTKSKGEGLITLAPKSFINSYQENSSPSIR